jgi:hypothetical protein
MTDTPAGGRRIAFTSMFVTLKFDPDGRFAILTLTDPYTIPEWRGVMLDTMASDDFLKHQRLLVDRRSSKAQTTAFVDAVVAFLSFHASRLTQFRVAILVHDDAGLGMARMTSLKVELNSGKGEIQPFRDYDDAVRWLATS